MLNHQTHLAGLAVKLSKALDHLEYSFNKIQTLSRYNLSDDEETLQTWESFETRFRRVADIFLTHYIRTAITINDPGFNGTMRDFLNKAEKLDLIDDAHAWIDIRALRNITAHEYNDEELAEFYARLVKETPRLLSINTLISKDN